MKKVLPVMTEPTVKPRVIFFNKGCFWFGDDIKINPKI
jgi:G:T-mismatch repair DNA endonuclease (very short patch repair protein)